MRALLVAAVICGCRGWVLPVPVAPFNWVRRGAPPRQPGGLHNSRVQGFVLPSGKLSPRSTGLCNAAPSAGDGEGQALQETVSNDSNGCVAVLFLQFSLHACPRRTHSIYYAY